MSICPVSIGQCDCQPSEGVGCTATDEKSVVARLAYEAGEYTANRVKDDRYHDACAKIARLESELAEARKVPVEPTDAMCDAGFRALRERGAELFDSDDMRYAYAFMIAAAPQPPAVAREDV